jgi:hypothetical protein
MKTSTLIWIAGVVLGALLVGCGDAEQPVPYEGPTPGKFGSINNQSSYMSDDQANLLLGLFRTFEPLDGRPIRLTIVDTNEDAAGRTIGNFLVIAWDLTALGYGPDAYTVEVATFAFAQELCRANGNTTWLCLGTHLRDGSAAAQTAEIFASAFVESTL